LKLRNDILRISYRSSAMRKLARSSHSIKHEVENNSLPYRCEIAESRRSLVCAHVMRRGFPVEYQQVREREGGRKRERDVHSRRVRTRKRGRKRENSLVIFGHFIFALVSLCRPPPPPPLSSSSLSPHGLTRGERYWINNALITFRWHDQRGGGVCISELYAMADYSDKIQPYAGICIP